MIPRCASTGARLAERATACELPAAATVKRGKRSARPSPRIMAMCAMTAEKIAIGGRKVGLGWMAHCPTHDDSEPSLSIRDAAGALPCRCDQGGFWRLPAAQVPVFPTPRRPT